MAELDGRVALVTGAGMGIGEACAVALARAGARVLIAEIDPAAGERAAAAIRAAGGEACSAVADVRRLADTNAARRWPRRCCFSRAIGRASSPATSSGSTAAS